MSLTSLSTFSEPGFKTGLCFGGNLEESITQVVSLPGPLRRLVLLPVSKFPSLEAAVLPAVRLGGGAHGGAWRTGPRRCSSTGPPQVGDPPATRGKQEQEHPCPPALLRSGGLTWLVCLPTAQGSVALVLAHLHPSSAGPACPKSTVAGAGTSWCLHCPLHTVLLQLCLATSHPTPGAQPHAKRV